MGDICENKRVYHRLLYSKGISALHTLALRFLSAQQLITTRTERELISNIGENLFETLDFPMEK